MALQIHPTCSLYHWLFLPFLFIFVTCLDCRPPAIFFNVYIVGPLKHPPLKHHHSYLSPCSQAVAYTEGAASQMEQPNLSLQIQSSQSFMVGRKSTLRQCYPESLWGPPWNSSDHLIFCSEKTNSAAPEGTVPGSMRSSNLGITLEVLPRTVSHFQVATSIHKQFLSMG